MGDTLNLFPARAAIGRVDGAGNVYMTTEFSRALAGLMVRVGGPVSSNLDDVALEVATEASAVGLHLVRAVEQLEQQITQNMQLVALVGELRKRVADLERGTAHAPTPTDWEHPGKIGAATPNTARFTTINRVTITAPVGAATLTLSDGKTFTVTNSVALAGVDGKTLTVNNTLGFSGTDGAFLNIGTGGTLGSAAYSSASSFAARSTTALAPVATDAASTQTLANSLRSILLSVGIGS